MKSRTGVSVIIPAYNEAGNITGAVMSAVKSVSTLSGPYEIIIVDDASSDSTGSLGMELADKYPHIRYVRRAENGGLGKAFLTGVHNAHMPYVTWFPGDNDTSGKSLLDLILARESADLVMAYTVNPETRDWTRRIISRSFTEFVNLLMGFHIRYYNGCFITKSSLITSTLLKSTGHGIFAELKVKLLKREISYKEIPFYHIGRKTGTTTAFRLKNILSTLQTVWVLISDVRLKRASA